jgi:glycerophosphoryl diester phosphodiesterase
MLERLTRGGLVAVAAHRGYKSAYPENTLLAFHEALKLGVDMLEFDLRLSRDGVVMIMHDATLDRTTDGFGPIGDWDLALLKRLDAGGWFGKPFEGLKIPTLAELCELLAAYPDVLLNVEIKPDVRAIEAADRGIALLREYGYLPHCVFTSFDAAVLRYIHDTYQLKTQGFPAELMSNFEAGEGGTYSRMWAVGLSMDLLTPERVEEFRRIGILPWCYCPDDEAQVRYALECGVTLMTCNNPLPALHRIRNL